MNAKASTSHDYRTVLSRCLRLRCPACGKGRFLKGWWRAHDCCSDCGYDFVREPGFYLGSIYVNYGLTVALVLAVCMPMLLSGASYLRLLPPAILFSVGFPVCFHRYARSIWLGLDYCWDGFHPVDNPNADASHDSADGVGASQSGADACSDNETIGICPFCHHHGRYEKSKLGSWVECKKCRQQILLTTPAPSG